MNFRELEQFDSELFAATDKELKRQQCLLAQPYLKGILQLVG